MKILLYLRILLIIAFVISLAFNIRLYLENEALKELVETHLEIEKSDLKVILNDIIEVWKI